MLTQGPIPRFVHGLIEYAAGVLLIIAPFLLDYAGEDGAATAISIILGVAIIAVAATTEGTTSLANAIPISLHVALDYALAALLVASPFIFGFYDTEGEATALFIGLGVAHLLITIGTRFHRDRR